MLHSSECPIIFLPARPAPIDEIVFAYNERENRVFALKQFTNLFPAYTKLETTIVCINYDQEKEEKPDLKYIKEFATGHFKLLSFIYLNLEKMAFLLWLSNQKKCTIGIRIV